MSWEAMEDVEQCHILQLAEYAHGKKLIKEPVFTRWVPHVLKKHSQIIGKVKTEYWQRTYKFGIE